MSADSRRWLRRRRERAAPHRALAVFLALLNLVGCGQPSATSLSYAASPDSCVQRIAAQHGSENALLVRSSNNPLRKLSPEFFGFNLEWIDFQQSLWDSARQEVSKSVIDWLSVFEGAVYRYPGGTSSNSFRWRDGLGSVSSRPVRERVDWLGPIRNEFGIDEYLDFVQRVKGRPWIVLNLVGTADSEQSEQQVAAEAAALVSYTSAKTESGAPPIFRWELGNELDRGGNKWSPHKYSARARVVASAVAERSPTAGFVAMLQDWPAQEKQYSVSAYNHAVMGGLQGITEYAHHLYYEELRWDTAESRLRLVCDSAQVAKSAGVAQPQFWITEHARGLPGNRGAEWKRNWPKTANLEAALIVAEAYIIATQVPQINGLFLHSLGTTRGPWPLFNAGPNGTVHPSAVYWGIRILRESMLPFALATVAQSRREAATIGGFNVRGTILTDETRARFTVWAVNRLGERSPLRLHLPELAGKSARGGITFITGPDVESNNYQSPAGVLTRSAAVDLSFDSKGNAQIALPPFSVSSLEFALQ